MTRRTSWLLWGALAVCMAVAGYWLARELDSSNAPLASGTWLPAPRELGSFALTDQSGARFTQAQLAGGWSLVFFGFTHCPDVCPGTLLKLAQARRAAAVSGLRVVFITVDPARDTPALLAQYVHAFDSDFIALTGSEPAIATLAKRFGVAFERVDLPGGGYTMDHSATVFLLDRHGRMTAVFTPPFDVQQLAGDLRRVARS
jgi:protein SCO1/2